MKHFNFLKRLSLTLGLVFMLFGVANAQTLNESFEGSFPPTGWTLQSAASDVAPWTVSSSEAQAGSQSAKANIGGSSTYTNEWLISPSVLISSGDILTFYRYFNSGSASYPDTMEVLVSNNGMTSWNQLAIYTPDTASDAGFVLRSYDLSTFTGSNCHVAFRYASAWGYSSYIDDVTIQPAPTCLPPTNLSATNLTTSSADLSWTTGGASNWNLEWGTTGFTQGSGTMVTNANKPYPLTGLTATTGYDFYVQDSCSAIDLSTWAGPYTFTTMAPTQTLPFTDGFETDLSAWVLSGSSTPSLSTSYVKSGSNSVNMISDGSSTGSMTAQFNAATDPRLSVSYYVDNYSYHDFTIEIQEAGSATWTEIHSWDTEYGTSSDDDIWIDIVEMDLAAYDTESGTFKIRMNGITTYSYSGYYKIYVDDFYIYEPSQNDMATLEIIAPVSGIEFSGPQDVSIKYENKGVAAQSNIPVMYSVDGGITIVTETIAGPIAPDSIGVYTFTQKATLVSGINYCGAVVSNPGDTVNNNDTVFAEIYNYALPYENDFEGEVDGEMPEGWIGINTTTSTGYLYADNYSTYAHSGTWSLRMYNSGSTTGDLIAVMPKYGGATLSDKWIQLQVRGEGSSMIVGVMTDPTDPATFVGIDTIMPPDGSYMQKIIKFSSYTGSGKYIAFKHGLENTYDDVNIDNLKLYQPSANNLAVVDIVAPNSAIDNSASQDFIIRITNQGSASQSNIPVKYTIDGGSTIITETFAGPINTFDTASFTFSQKASLAAGVNYCAAVVSNPGDTINDNDTAFAEIINYALPYYNDFESETSSNMPENWSYIETYSYAFAYAYSSSTYAYDGSMSFRLYNSGASSTDDVIAILPKYEGTTLTDKWLSMAVRGQDDSPLIIGVLSDPTDESTFIGVDTIIPPDESYSKYIIKFNNYSGSGKYIGLKHGCATTYDYIYIDNLELFVPDANSVKPIVEPIKTVIADNGNKDVIVKLVNLGSATQNSIPVSYTVDGGNTVVNETCTLSLASLDTVEYTFSQQLVLPSGENQLDVYTSLATDADNTDDSASIVVKNLSLPYFTSFENDADGDIPDGWSIFNDLSQTSVQTFVEYLSSSVTGTQSFELYNASYTSGSLIGIMPSYGGSLTDKWVDFYVRGDNADDTLLVGVMTDPNDETTFTVVDTILPPAGSFERTYVTFENYSGSGKYIAFKLVLHTTNINLYIDDLRFDVKPTNPILETIPDSVAFADIFNENDSIIETVKLVNNGIGNYVVSQPVLSGLNSAAFIVNDTNTYPKTIGWGGEIVFDVKFKSSTIGVKNAQFDITANTENYTIPLNGRVNSSIIDTFPYIVDFENDGNLPFRFRTVDLGYEWELLNGPTTSSYTGPNNDKTTGSGYYIVTDAGDGSEGDSTLLITREIDMSTAYLPQMNFWYHMYGADMGKLYIDIAENGTWINAVDSIVGQQHNDNSDDWSIRVIDLTQYPAADSVRFVSVCGSGYRGDMAIDDIGFGNGFNVDLGPDTLNCTDVITLDPGYQTGWTYKWYDMSDTSLVGTSQTLDVDTSGTYVVEVYNEYFFRGTDTINVDTDTKPTLSLNTVADQCANNDNITLNFASPLGGTYSGNFVSSGEFSPVNAGAGTHYAVYSYTDQYKCTAVDSASILVNSIPNIVTTPLSDICVNGASFSLGFASPVGGTYSGAGVDISGNFDPSIAGVGSHYLSYTYTDGNTCVNSDSVQITVNDIPVISIPTMSDVCVDAASFALTGATPSGGTWSGPGVDASGNFDPATAGAGMHYIKYEFVDANSCWNIDSTTITVNPLPVIAASATPNPVNYGTTSSLDVSVGSSTYSYLWSPADSLQNVADTNIKNPTTKNLSMLTTFTVQVTDDVTGCSQSDNVAISITGGPLTTTPIAAHDTLCVGDSTTLSAQPSGGNGSYTYSWTSNPAGFTSPDENPKVQVNEATWFIVAVNDGFNTVTDSVEVGSWALPTIGFTAMNDLCVDASAINLSAASPVGGVYSGVGVSSGDFDPVTAGVGTHYIKYEYTDGNGCYNIDSSTIIVNDLPIITITAVNDICVDASPLSLGFASPTGGTYSGLGVSSGDFDPAIAGVGAHFITYTYTDGNSCVNSDSVEITVNDLPAISIPTMNDVCVDAASFALTGATPTGGTWSGTGVDASANFDPATAGVGTHYIKYEYTDANTCYNIDSVAITVNALPVITFTAFADICVDASSLSLNNASPVGGTYSGVGVSSGSFDPSVAGVGTHYIVYSYTDGNGCYNMDSTTIVVNDIPSITTTALSPICVDAAPITLGFASPTGGTYSGLGVSSGSFDPAIAGAGTHYIIYTYTDGNSCANSDSVAIVVNPLPVISIPAMSDVCVDAASFALTGATPAAGTWSGIGVASGNFDPATAGVGTHYIKYEYTDANTCYNIDSVAINVNALPILSLTTLADVCVDASSFALTGATPSGGTWSGIGVDASGNFDPSVAGAGTHYLKYAYTDGNGCYSIDSTTILVNALPVISISNLDPEYCSNGTGSTLVGSPVGGTFAGDGITGNYFDPTVATIGNVQISYTYTDLNSCTNTENVTTEVLPLPNYSLTSDTVICETGNLLLDPMSDLSSSYVWSTGDLTPTITIDTTGFGIGVFTINYSITDTNNCTISDSLDVEFEAMPAEITVDTVDICGQDQIINLQAAAGNYNYLWSTGDTTAQISIDTAIAGTSYFTVNVSVSGKACVMNDSVEVIFYPAAIVNLGNDTSLCINWTYDLDAGSGYNYLWTDGSTNQIYTFDAKDAGLGYHTVGVTVTSPDGCIADDNLMIKVDPCTGIEDLNASSDINVYPNPTDGQFTVSIDGIDGDVRMQLLSSEGKMLFNEEFKVNNSLIKDFDASTFAKGVYYIRIMTNEQTQVYKVIIQ